MPKHLHTPGQPLIAATDPKLVDRLRFELADTSCDMCGAVLFVAEQKHCCCAESAPLARLLLPMRPTATPRVAALIDSDMKAFRNICLSVNRLTALASRMANEKRFTAGMPAYSVQGTVYSTVNSLTPSKSASHDDGSGSFLQLFFYDRSVSHGAAARTYIHMSRPAFCSLAKCCVYYNV